MDIPRPTSEDECADHCGYAYTNKNIISYKLLREQRRYIRRENRNSRQCDCRIINGKKCDTSACENRLNSISCGPGCSHNCYNCPWNSPDHGFVAGTKTYLVMDAEKGASIYAYEDIEERTFIGEYTGIVRPSSYRFSARQMTYTMQLGDTGQVIVGQGVGSIVTRINHSCVPNCKAYLYVHENQYKVVIIVIKVIRKDEELTIDYGWTYKKGEEHTRMRCYCGLEGVHYIEKLEDPADATHTTTRRAIRRRNKTTNNIDDSQPNFNLVARTVEMEAEMASSVLSKERPVGYYESHVFEARDEVFLITSNNRRALQPIGGRVAHCYRNKAKIAIIVVRTNIEGIRTHHVPRWLCFRYAEDAAFRLQRLSESDKERVTAYTEGMTSRRKAAVLRNRLMTDYIKLWNADELPYIKQVANVLESGQGGTAIGILPNVLVDLNEQVDPTASGASDESDDNGNGGGDQDGDEEYAAPLTGRQIVPSLKRVHRRMVIYSSSSSSSDEEQNDAAARDEEHLEGSIVEDHNEIEVEVISPLEQFDNKYRRDFDELKDEIERELSFNRTLQIAIENVTFFALSRIRKERKVRYHEMMPIIRRELEYMYFREPIGERHYLRFGHYHQAIEVVHPGSWQLRWCSLCRLAYTFKTEHEMRSHFYIHHAIISGTYSCPRCKAYFVFPSEIRAHVDTCCPSYASTLVSTVGNHILDAYADYYASKGTGNHPKYIIKPGLPYKHIRNVPQSTEYIEMDRISGEPKNKKIKLHPTKMSLQLKCKAILESWESINFKINKKIAPILRLRNLFNWGPSSQNQPTVTVAVRPAASTPIEPQTGRATTAPAEATTISSTTTSTVTVSASDRIIVDGIVVDDQVPGSSRQIPTGQVKMTTAPKGNNKKKQPEKGTTKTSKGQVGEMIPRSRATKNNVKPATHVENTPVAHKTRSRLRANVHMHKEATSGLDSDNNSTDDQIPPPAKGGKVKPMKHCQKPRIANTAASSTEPRPKNQCKKANGEKSSVPAKPNQNSKGKKNIPSEASDSSISPSEEQGMKKKRRQN